MNRLFCLLGWTLMWLPAAPACGEPVADPGKVAARAGEDAASARSAQWGDLGNGRYRNPVLPADYSDLDAIRVGDDYYAISSTFQFSPGMGAPLHQVLRAPGWDDCTPFWDDDGKGYFIGTNFSDGYQIHLWEMSPDNKNLIPASGRVIYQSKGSEASKLYKINGTYYHFFSEVQGDLRVMMMRRAPSIRGPWSDKRQLMHGDRSAMQPNQGGIVQGPDQNWYFFTHHGDGDWAGRAASLLPVHWVDGWPVIGQPDQAGIGTMVWEAKMPVSAFPRQFPQGSDNFDARTLAPIWEWNYQPRVDKWSLSERPGFLRLHGFAGLDGANLLKVGNVLTQRVVRTSGQSFVARLELNGMADGQHAGLAHFTAQPRASNPAESTGSAGIVMADGKGYVEISRDGRYTRLQPWAHDAIWLRSSWGLDGKSSLAVSADGKQFEPVLADFPLTWGAYRGSRVGLFTFNSAAEHGYVDVDAVSYAIDNRAGAAAQ